jgi:hypothetical protein
MKNVLVFLVLYGLSWINVNAQIEAGRNSDRYAYNRDFESYKWKNNSNNNWGYDNNWNVRRGNFKVNSFQNQARMRIADGISKGFINSSESRNLLRFYERIERKENLFRRNGRISRREAAELNRDLNHLNLMITKAINNGRRFHDNRRNRN